MKRFSQTHRYELESLESRRLLSTLIVSSAADSGSGSLRAQIAAAQSGDTISFAPSLAGQTITLTSGVLTIAKNLEVQGLGADRLTIDGNYAGWVFSIFSSVTNAQIRDLTITRGGGAIANHGVLTVTNCTLSNNVANNGGAIVNSGTLNLSGSTLSGNIAAVGVSSYDAAGGAIYSAAGALTVSNCTFANNRAVGGQVPVWDPDSWVFLGYEGYDAYGGAIYVGGGTASIDHSTFVGNSAEGGYGDLRQGVGAYGAIVGGQVSNSIIADNFADYRPADGGFTSLGHNLIGNSSGAIFAASDLLNVNPQLGLLQNNGGPTQTIALFPGSPAINAGDNTGANVYDQRGVGFPRIVGGTIDIGAFESGTSIGRTWVGPTTGGDWSTAANWSPIGVPAASDLVAISGKSVNLSANATVATLTLTGGASLTVTAAGNRLLRTSSLAISPDSKLNLNDNGLILNYNGATPMTEIAALLAAGRGASATGIYSPQANAAGGLHALVAAEASNLLGISGSATTTWNGQTVDATSVLIEYAASGDANLDGDVDLDDVGRWSVNFTGELGGVGATKTWFQGDWDYDGDVDLDDVGKWSVNFTGELGGAGAALATDLGQSPQASAQNLIATRLPAPRTISRSSPFSNQPIMTAAKATFSDSVDSRLADPIGSHLSVA